MGNQGSPRGGGLASPAGVPGKIGQYTPLRVLGQGGMGTVYEAQQENPRRAVALKVIRAGYLSDELLHRFKQEAQVLGRLQHPGIAQVYEAGVVRDERGGDLPFFAMEFIKGVPLTDYAAARGLGTRERLDLFAKVCDAVYHAHQKGVIHRDLKPGNILVDESGQPKILDFGVARATDSDIQQTTQQTDIGQLIGTVPYMSPEQVSGDPGDLDTRSDVYALGVIAYELLAGRLPYDLRRKMIHEAARIIKEEEPTRLSSINRTLRGDVETIVAKAMEKDKVRRYQSAESLASDIRRYLKDEPIAARPASTWYQVTKFSQRHTGLVAGVVAAFVILVGGIAATGLVLRRALSAETSLATQLQETEKARTAEAVERTRADERAEEAIRQEAEARKQQATAEAIAKFQTEMLATADPDKLLGDKVTVLQAMQAAVKVLDEGSLKDQPLVEAGVRDTIGNTLRGLARYDEAEPNLRKSLEICRTVLPVGHPDIAPSMNSLAMLLKAKNQLAEAESLFREALDIRRATLPAGHPDIAVGMNNLAALLKAQNRLAEAEPLDREALDIRRAALPAGHPGIANSLMNLGFLLQAQNNLAEAEPLFREALEIFRATLPAGHPDIALGLSNLGHLLKAQNNLAEAEPLLREALEIFRAALPAMHPNVAQSASNLAALLKAQSKLAEAEPLDREALEIRRVALPAGHPGIANSLNNLAYLLQIQNKLFEAEPLYREALEIFRAARPAGHPDIAICLDNLAKVLRDQHRLTEAEPLFSETLEIWRATYPPGHPYILASCYKLADLLIRVGQTEKAAPLVEECVEGMTSTLGAAHQNTRRAIALAVTLYESWDKAEPGKGYDAKAAAWKAKLDALNADSAAPAASATSSEPK